MAKDIMTFNSEEEAIDWGSENLGKYGSELVKIGDRYTLLCGTSMVDDEGLRGGIETAVINWIEDFGLAECFDEDPDVVAVDFGAELNELAMKLLDKWYNFDVIYCSDTY